MKVLVFDTETSGLPKAKAISENTLNLWPHILQFSYVIYDTVLNDIIEINDNIVKVSEDVFIAEDSIKVHGITNEYSDENGIPIDDIFNDFFYHLLNVDLLVGHNVSFDINMVRVELCRMIYQNMAKKDSKSENILNLCKYNLNLLVNSKNICCTLQDSIELCKIEAIDKYGRPYFKYPKLAELHQKLFETVPNNLHNSLNDILVTLRCYVKMKHGHDLNETCIKFIEIVKNKRLL
jgi:DNA polymerase III epsilon subunit-like protein